MIDIIDNEKNKHVLFVLSTKLAHLKLINQLQVIKALHNIHDITGKLSYDKAEETLNAMLGEDKAKPILQALFHVDAYAAGLTLTLLGGKPILMQKDIKLAKRVSEKRLELDLNAYKTETQTPKDFFEKLKDDKITGNSAKLKFAASVLTFDNNPIDSSQQKQLARFIIKSMSVVLNGDTTWLPMITEFTKKIKHLDLMDDLHEALTSLKRKAIGLSTKNIDSIDEIIKQLDVERKLKPYEDQLSEILPANLRKSC